MVFGGAYMFWEKPRIIGCMGYNEAIKVLSLREPATVLYWPTWLWTPRTLPELFKLRALAYLKGKQIHFMCNTPAEDAMLRRWFFPGELVSINCFPNEDLFRPLDEVKSYDASYVAQMKPFKRMHLAAEIPSIYVVTYGQHKAPDGSYDLHGFEPAIAHADFNRGWSTYDQIVAVLNRSRVALALSECEGAMLASVEAMLCGLPLVSTPCQGGRELFFDERYVSVVEPNASAVAAGVRGMIDRKIDPAVVRSGTLERINVHRGVLCRYIQRLAGQAGVPLPELDEIHDRLFPRQQGSIARFVSFKDFEARGIR